MSETGNIFFGMHFGWWLFWIIVILGIITTPYEFPGQRRRKDSPHYILKNLYASGKISKGEYNEKKKFLALIYQNEIFEQ